MRTPPGLATLPRRMQVGSMRRPGIVHTEPCGCKFEQIDAPDDQWIGQGWRLVLIDPLCTRGHRS